MEEKNARNSQHPIPQNFMDVEFKIIGELTMRQFVYLCAFGGPAYLFYTIPLNPFIKWPFIVLFGGLALILTSVPIDDRGADEWIVNFIRAVYGVNQRVYKKNSEIPIMLSMKSMEFIQASVIATTSTSNRRKVEEYIKGISKTEEKTDLDDFNFSSRKFVDIQISPVAESIIQSNLALKIETKASTTVEKSYQEVVLASPLDTLNPPEVKKFEIKKTVFSPMILKIIPQRIKTLSKTFVDIQDQLRTSSSEVPGRKFISFSKKEAEELILPIRGEKSINIFDTTPIIESASSRKDVKVLARELEVITKEAKKTYGVESFGRTLDLDSKDLVSNIGIKNNLIEGLVIDSLGNPLENINIQILTKINEAIDNTQTSNEGKFSFNNIQRGDYQLRILNPYLYQLNFDIINFNVQNFPYPLIKIVGRK